MSRDVADKWERFEAFIDGFVKAAIISLVGLLAKRLFRREARCWAGGCWESESGISLEELGSVSMVGGAGVDDDGEGGVGIASKLRRRRAGEKGGTRGVLGSKAGDEGIGVDIVGVCDVAGRVGTTAEDGFACANGFLENTDRALGSVTDIIELSLFFCFVCEDAAVALADLIVFASTFFSPSVFDSRSSGTSSRRSITM
jgi:hypothetical protein